MKVRQLSAVSGTNRDALVAAATSRADWHVFADWWRSFGELVRTQDRAKLDFELPDEYVREVLAEVFNPYYEGADGLLRPFQFAPDDRELFILEAFDKHGGSAVEEAHEEGVWVPPKQ